MEKIQVQAQEGTQEIIIREGSALPAHPPVKIRIDGTLKAPADFLEKKTGNYVPKNLHLLISNNSGKLELIMDEKEENGDKVTGSLLINPILASFGINTDRTWSISELRKFIQQKSYHFADRDEYLKLLQSLQKFRAQVVKLYQNENTNDGNSKIAFENKVQEANNVQSFKMQCPIYLGYEKHSFDVEIGLDVSSAETKLFLYSEHLYELLEGLKEKYIKQELDRFREMEMDFSFVTIN